MRCLSSSFSSVLCAQGKCPVTGWPEVSGNPRVRGWAASTHPYEDLDGLGAGDTRGATGDVLGDDAEGAQRGVLAAVVLGATEDVSQASHHGTPHATPLRSLSPSSAERGHPAAHGALTTAHAPGSLCTPHPHIAREGHRRWAVKGPAPPTHRPPHWAGSSSGPAKWGPESRGGCWPHLSSHVRAVSIKVVVLPIKGDVVAAPIDGTGAVAHGLGAGPAPSLAGAEESERGAWSLALPPRTEGHRAKSPRNCEDSSRNPAPASPRQPKSTVQHPHSGQGTAGGVGRGPQPSL